VAKSPPDGHLMLVAPASFTMGPHLSRNPPYNPVTDFAPINLVADVPFVMVVPAALPARTVKDFIELAKKSPEKLSFGLVGVGTPQHLGAELFKMHAGRGSRSCAVPRRHGGPAGSGGRPHRHVHRRHQFTAAADPEGQAARHRRDQPQRIASLPDVPTLSETFPGFEVGSAIGLVAPAGTPPDVVATLNREIASIIATPGFHQRMAAIGVDVVGTTPAAYAKFISDDYAKWGKVVAAGGIKPE
jgi:tripartite-type tricarboxylate transporter receptor subunit TctC